jgi:glycerol-3-phosphate acyltransferase PlsY
MTPPIWIMLTGTYLLGAVPTAYLFVRLVTGQDIRLLGDGNLGAKNTYQSVARWMGYSVAGIDIAKGYLVVRTARQLGFSEGVVLLAGAVLILGHDFSVFLNFQGGQGMAVTVGVFLGLFPQITLAAFLSFLMFLSLTKNWDLSCGLGFFLLITAVWATDHPIQQLIFAMLILPWIGIRKMLQSMQSRYLGV